MSLDHFDVLIVGAGLSGIAAGYYLRTEYPSRSYTILEGRGELGGTWDLLGPTSGYVRRALNLLPKQGPKAPWAIDSGH